MAAVINITSDCTHRFRTAFTLIELMITIAVAVILAAVAAPSFQTLILNARLSGKKNEFINALNLARTTALAQNSNIVVCPYSAAGSATCGTSWSAGWIVKTQPITGTATLLKGYQSSAKDPILSAVAFSGAAASSITFDPRGLSTTPSYFKLCDSRGVAYAVSMQILLTGFIQTGPTPAPGQAIWGGSLSCP